MPYPGGKGRMYQRLISLMPPHRVYIETHLGGGAVLQRKRPAEVNIAIDCDPKVIEDWRLRCAAHVDLVLGDAVAFLETYRFRGDEFVYCDPPYLPSTRRRARVYRHDYQADDHVRLLSCLREAQCRVMISGYRSTLYNRELPGWNRLDFPHRTQQGETTESVWLNYDPPQHLHDHSHLGSDFREREAVKRRRLRLVRRVLELSQAERNALLAELAVRDPGSFSGLAGRIQ